jgi:hypothetical protein
MLLRDLATRARAALHSLSRAERHRRQQERYLALPLKELSPVDAAEVARIGEAIHAWKTGEVPIVAEVDDEFKPGIYTHDEPIGPRPPTVDERYAAFQLDPLGAELPGAPARDNVLFTEQIGRHRAEKLLAHEVLHDLENTGPIDASFLAKLARGER